MSGIDRRLRRNREKVARQKAYRLKNVEFGTVEGQSDPRMVIVWLFGISAVILGLIAWLT